MKIPYRNLLTLRLSNPNSTKFCDIKFNYSKNKTLYSKTFDNGKLLEYKSEQSYVKYSPNSGSPVTSIFEDAFTKIVRNFHKNSNKLKSLFKLNKSTGEKYIANFDNKENLIDLLLNDTKNNKYTSFVMNENGDIIDFKGDTFDKNIANIKYNRKADRFEFRTNKETSSAENSILTTQTLYIDNPDNKISKDYINMQFNNGTTEESTTSVDTYIEKDGTRQLLEEILYDTKTKELIFHGIKDSNNDYVYLAARITNEDGSKSYRLVSDFNNGKTIEIKNPDKI